MRRAVSALLLVGLLAVGDLRAALLFDDASSESLNLASAPITAQPLSVSVWFNGDASGDLTIWSLSQNGSSDEGFIVGRNAGNLVFTARTGGGSESASTAGISNGTWHHAMAVASAINNRIIRLDGGVPGTNLIGTTPMSLNRMDVGRFQGATTWSGHLAELALWNVALTTAEQDALAKAIDPRQIRPASLVGYWPLDANSVHKGGGTSTLDRWKNGYTLTEANSPTLSTHPRMFYQDGGH